MSNNNQQLFCDSHLIGTINIMKSNRSTQRAIRVNCDWFLGYEYFIIDDDGGRIVFKKCYMEIPKRAYKLPQKGVFTILSDAQLGVFDTCIEESNEDELVVYYNLNYFKNGI